jgi:toxin ParE1/3/4
MPGYRISRPAANDLRGINRYTAQRWGVEQARAYYARLLQCFEMLAENPALGVARPGVREGYRSFVEGSHVIFYQEQGDTIRIVRVLHGRQDVRGALGSEGEPEQ